MRTAQHLQNLQAAVNHVAALYRHSQALGHDAEDEHSVHALLGRAARAPNHNQQAKHSTHKQRSPHPEARVDAMRATFLERSLKALGFDTSPKSSMGKETVATWVGATFINSRRTLSVVGINRFRT